jgi:F0F1-type ATP synthase delta subunit
MLQTTYAKAIDRLVASGTNQGGIADSLVAHLKSRGRLKLLPGILNELKASEARHKTSDARVEVASEKESAAALRAAKEAGIDVAQAHVNHSLLHGWRAQTKGMLIDRSGKRALLDLYRRITDA